MNIEISDELLKSGKISIKDLKIEIGLLLYKNNVFTLGQASKFAGIHQIEMQREMKKHNVYLNYDLDSFHQDLKTLNEP